MKYRQKPPPQTPKLGEMVRIIAGFGGFLGRKSDGFSGTKTLWEGMEKARHFEPIQKRQPPDLNRNLSSLTGAKT